MYAGIKAIEYHLPERVLSNEMLTEEFPEWPAEKIEEKTGIKERRIASEGECSSDLAASAAVKLFESGACDPADVDFLILCTQSPDYFLPTSSCILQDRLGIRRNTGAFDFNLGCSGFVYGLGIAKGLIETGQAGNVLLLTAETYSKFINPRDKSVRSLFGDAAAAILLGRVADSSVNQPPIGPFIYGTDGRGASNLIVPCGGLRHRKPEPGDGPFTDEFGNTRGPEDLYMNGPEIFTFTLSAVPQAYRSLISKACIDEKEIDLFVFHQANRYMLEAIRKKISIPPEKYPVMIDSFGNTVSCTIPIALKELANEGKLFPGARVMLIGFGVGYSWAATMITWTT